MHNQVAGCKLGEKVAENFVAGDTDSNYKQERY